MSERARVLIVDDERIVRDSLGKWFQEEGYEVGTAESAPEALRLLAEKSWDLALVDIKMPGTDGIELQRRLRVVDPELIVIIITGYASVGTAVAALKNGAYDYVTKPFDPDEIAATVRNALGLRRARRENARLRETVAAAVHLPEIIGRSPAARRVIESIETVAPTDATVLVLGPSGTGKELVARAIHASSPRRYNPLVVIHCGALTDSLLESELFGYEKGAFTGAQQRRRGKFEIGEGGTIFLDEVGDVSLKTQTDLLRVLEEREFTRVGGTQPVRVDFRVIAATNQDLEKMVEDGSFRLDLYYRLNVFRIELPSLDERRDDIPLLVEHFVRKFALQMNRRITGATPAALARLAEHSWPGNVRELENAVERAMVVARGPELAEGDFELHSEREREPKALEEVERLHILRVLEECGGNQTRAAAALGIDRVTLHNRLKKYGWTREPTPA